MQLVQFSESSYEATLLCFGTGYMDELSRLPGCSNKKLPLSRTVHFVPQYQQWVIASILFRDILALPH